jgi:hypothetical protein
MPGESLEVDRPARPQALDLAEDERLPDPVRPRRTNVLGARQIASSRRTSAR